MKREKKSFHLHMLSDATGETLISVGRAVASQYTMSQATEHIYPMIRNKTQLQRALDEIQQEPGIVLYTIIDKKIKILLRKRCEKIEIPCIDILHPVLNAFKSYLGIPTNLRVSAQHGLNADYFRRIEALDFTIEHDDGQSPNSLSDADVILVGISRTSKTPTSIYLANRGIKTANVPLIPGINLPDTLLGAKNALIIGLIASVEQISHIRQNRNLGDDFSLESYTDRINISEELTYAKRICERFSWPVIDVTRRSIEETAAEIFELLSRFREGK
ncbi:pyruvate, water dikinase regulatory protein [Bartonella henselae]|uniref:pyruvate, water dikinase regulatory protein n=1 Tax=Bartonella henselae TaxID=38323 RepID=UPI0009633575|nr:pyruvate, water dikinase regulatory protein [Bartonella henselae]OLL41407.1 phosphoenolpyruvate synthase regulatory protein [Bartonella henselae]OLL47062.1 phosphoenolpyruvate synthase regulatory protein [Bartonella henselae]